MCRKDELTAPISACRCTAHLEPHLQPVPSKRHCPPPAPLLPASGEEPNAPDAPLEAAPRFLSPPPTPQGTFGTFCRLYLRLYLRNGLGMGTLLTTSPALPPPGARSEPPSHPCPGLLQGPHSFQHGRTHALPTACSPHTGHDPLKANSCSEPSLAPHLTRAAAPATPPLRRGPHGKLLATSGPCARPRTCPSLRVECCSPQMCACAHTHFI